MKVLHVINSLETAGAEKLLLETLPLYNKKGITADLLVLNGEPFPFYKLLEAENCCTIHGLGKGMLLNPFFVFKIIPFFRKYQLVHVHLFPSLYWVVIAKIISFSKIPLIYTEHATTNKRMENALFRIVDKYIYSKLNTIICISEDVEKSIKHHLHSQKNNLLLIKNGVNISKIVNETPYIKSEINPALGQDDIILLQVSRFQSPKDQKTLIKALLHLPQNVHVVLVGDGDLRKDSEELVFELRLTSKVHFLGIRLDIPKLLKTADIVVLSSNYEGLSLASIEGLASGKPFVASDVPGLTEVVNGAGVLFECQNEKKLAFEIQKLITDDDYYSSIILKCIDRAKEYDIEKMVRKHLELYFSYNK